MVRPTMYLENFLRPDAREEIRNNGKITYSLPASRKIAWTSTDDLANAALALLENRAFGGDYSVAGAEAVDGEGLARAFSNALKRNIQFQSLPLEDFEQAVDPKSAAGIARRFASATIRFITDHADEATGFLSQPFRPSPQLAGFKATSIQDWIRERSLMFV